MTLKQRIIAAIAPYPRIYFAASRLLGPRWHRYQRVERDTELVIAGFARSANTFAVVAFREAQGRPLQMAHHLHVEAQALEGVRRRLPVIVLLRNPVDAIRSLKLVNPGIDENWALRRWIAFYSAIEKVRDRVVIAPFGRVTSDFGAVIDELNARFGTHFKPFEHTPANIEHVFSEILRDSYNMGTLAYASVPSPERDALKAAVRLDFDPRLLARAQELCRRLAVRDDAEGSCCGPGGASPSGKAGSAAAFFPAALASAMLKSMGDFPIYALG